MGLIKRQFAEPAAKSAIVLDLGDIAEQARKIREAAEVEAERIVEEARRRADELAAQAHNDASERGHAEGYEAGREQGRREGHAEAVKESRARLGAIDEAWGAAVDGWESHREQLGREAHHAVVRLALRLGERVVRRAIHVDRSVAARQVADALAYVLRPVDVTVRICPEDRAILEDALPGLMERLGHIKHVRLSDDAGVSRGGCVVAYGQGQVDATVETQLDRMVRTLLPETEAGVDAGPADGDAERASDTTSGRDPGEPGDEGDEAPAQGRTDDPGRRGGDPDDGGGTPGGAADGGEAAGPTKSGGGPS